MERSERLEASSGKRATMSALRQCASELRKLVSDGNWVGNEVEETRVQSHINELVLEILGLPKRPTSGELTVEYRLARAEAERLHGSCIEFERSLAIVDRQGDTAVADLNYAGDQLFVATGAFLAMAEDVQD